MKILDWLLHVLMVDPPALSDSSDNGQHEALNEIREHIDKLRNDSTLIERRLVALERQQQRSQGWISDPPDKDYPA